MAEAYAVEGSGNPFAEPDKTYIIDHTVDLGGQSVSLPRGCVLVFKKSGQITNGTLTGNETVVNAGKQLVFHLVTLKGSFSAKIAYSDWFDMADDCVLDSNSKYVAGINNIQSFRNLFLFSNISIRKGCYMLEEMLSCKSNQEVNGNGAVLKFLSKGICINIGGAGTVPVTNVTIKDLSIIGCKQEFADKTEWWHGINIGFAKDVRIEDVTCDQCRGDGFYVGTRINRVKDARIPANITFNRVKALHSHRNGLSITRAINATVTNSEFCHTAGTLPETGLDIEPNKVRINEDSLIVGEVENVRVSKCTFFGNGGEGFLIANQVSTKPSIRLIRNVHVSDCCFNDDDIVLSGCADCRLEKLHISNSIVKINGESIIRNLTLFNFDMLETEEGNKKNAIDLVYSRRWPVRSNVLISGMTIKGYGGTAIRVGKGLPLSEKKFDGLTISGCRISRCGNGIDVGNSVGNLKVTDNKVDGKEVASSSGNMVGLAVVSFSLLMFGMLAFVRRKRA